MHPPAHVCRQLYNVGKDLRLCWLGRSYVNEYVGDFDGLGQRIPEDELGCFGIIRLISPQLKVTQPELHELRHLGPVFGKNGEPRADWDQCTHKAVLIATVDSQFGFSHEDVYGTKLVQHMAQVKRTREQQAKLVRAEQERKERDKQSFKDDLVDAMTDNLMYSRKRHDGEYVVETNKHYKERKREMAKHRPFRGGFR